MFKFILKLTIVLFFVQSTLASCSIGAESDPNGKAKASDGENDNPKCMAALRNHIRLFH